VASGVPIDERSRHATTVMCCLSKGLGAPVGSLLAGPSELMDDALLHRKRLGGAMRQAGVIAAAGLVALRTRFERLSEDHARALRLARAVADRWPELGGEVERVDTNIVVFSSPDPAGLIHHLRTEDVLAGTIAPGVVRLVTHADVDDDGIKRACLALASAP
jgi:threonine aldolase